MSAPTLPPTTAAPRFSGWRVVIVLATAQACGLGLLMAFGIMVDPVATEFGISKATVGSGMSIFIFAMATVGVAIGPVVDRGPVRALMLGGVLTMLTGFALLAQATAGWQLAAALVLAALGIAAYGPLPVNGIIVNWFLEKRGTALAIAAAGPAVAGFGIPPLTAWLVAQGGWRSAVVVLGAGAAAIALPVIAVGVIRRPEDVGQHPDGREPSPQAAGATELDVEVPLSHWLRNRDVWRMGLGFGVLFCIPIGTLIFLVPFMSEQGIAPQYAAYALSLQAVAAALTGHWACAPVPLPNAPARRCASSDSDRNRLASGNSVRDR